MPTLHSGKSGNERNKKNATPSSTKSRKTDKKPNEISTGSFYKTTAPLVQSHLADTFLRKHEKPRGINLLLESHHSKIAGASKESLKTSNEIINLDESDGESPPVSKSGKMNPLDQALNYQMTQQHLNQFKSPLTSKMKPKSDGKKLGEFNSLAVHEAYRDGELLYKGESTLKIHERLILSTNVKELSTVETQDITHISV